MSRKIEKGPLVVSGKTKDVHEDANNNTQVIVTNRDEITKNDDASLTEQMQGKGKYATNTTCNIFELLEKANIPTAFVSRILENEESFIAKKVAMIPLEVIVRRYATGSYLERMPHLWQKEGLYRFEHLKFELFLKTSGGNLAIDDKKIVKDLKVDDPFIENPYDNVWNIVHPKQMNYTNDNEPLAVIESSSVLDTISISEIEELTRKTFLVIEAAWAINFGFKLIDFKIEFGIDENGILVVADVVDNDSWRLHTPQGKEVSKENFRQNLPFEDISETYKLVSVLSDSLPNIKKQTIVLWRGSESDDLPSIETLYGITVEKIVISAHKKTQKALDMLSLIESKYPQGGVIVAIVGMSNGLGPITGAHTNWPVINLPQGLENNPEDIHSSLNLPSNVPAMTIKSPKNAVLEALNILSLSNPIAAMYRRYRIEEVVNS